MGLSRNAPQTVMPPPVHVLFEDGTGAHTARTTRCTGPRGRKCNGTSLFRMGMRHIREGDGSDPFILVGVGVGGGSKGPEITVTTHFCPSKSKE